MKGFVPEVAPPHFLIGGEALQPGVQAWEAKFQGDDGQRLFLSGIQAFSLRQWLL